MSRTIAGIGRKLVRERLDIFLPFALVALFCLCGTTAGHDRILLPIGAVLSLSGFYLRAWSMKHCGKAGISENRVKTLTVSGPYNIFRNPLYVSNIFIVTGLLVISRVLWIIPAFLVYAFIRYNSIIKREEGALAAQFGEDYKEYCRKTHRWLPRLKWPAGKPKRGWGVVLKREAVEIVCCLVGAFALITKKIWLGKWILGMN